MCRLHREQMPRLVCSSHFSSPLTSALMNSTCLVKTTLMRGYMRGEGFPQVEIPFRESVHKCAPTCMLLTCRNASAERRDLCRQLKEFKKETISK